MALFQDDVLNSSFEIMAGMAESLGCPSQCSTVDPGTPTNSQTPYAASTPAACMSSRHGAPQRSYELLDNSADSSLTPLRLDTTADVSRRSEDGGFRSPNASQKSTDASVRSADVSIELLRSELEALRRQQEESQRQVDRQRQDQDARIQELVAQQVAQELERQGRAGRRGGAVNRRCVPAISVSIISYTYL